MLPQFVKGSQELRHKTIESMIEEGNSSQSKRIIALTKIQSIGERQYTRQEQVWNSKCILCLHRAPGIQTCPTEQEQHHAEYREMQFTGWVTKFVDAERKEGYTDNTQTTHSNTSKHEYSCRST